MKYLKLILTLAVILISFSFIASASSEPSVMISDYTLSPSILMPGDTALLTVTVYNAEVTGSQTNQIVDGGYTSIDIESNAGFIESMWVSDVSDDNDNEISGGATYSELGRIAGGASIPVAFELTVDRKMTEGQYFPKVKVNLESSSHDDLYYPIPVKVSNETVELIIKEIPSKISKSGSTDITLSVINNRENSVDSVTITPSGDLEFIPKSYFVGSMDPESSQDVSFSIIPDDVGDLNLTFDVSFKNGDNLHQNSLETSIEIINTLDVSPVIYNVPTYIGKGETGRLRLEVYNAKTEAISGVIVTPTTFDENVTISPSQYFIGSMDPDDVFTASFEVYTSSLKIGEEYDVDFKVTFKQDENYYETPSVSSSFTIIEPVAANQEALPCMSGIIILIVLIAAIVLYFIIKKRRTAR